MTRESEPRDADTSPTIRVAAKQKQAAAISSTPSTPKAKRTAANQGAGGSSGPAATTSKTDSAAPSQPQVSQVQQDLQGLGLEDEDGYVKEDVSTLPSISIAKEKLIEQIKAQEREEGFKPVISMVVVGERCTTCF